MTCLRGTDISNTIAYYFSLVVCLTHLKNNKHNFGELSFHQLKDNLYKCKEDIFFISAVNLCSFYAKKT